MPYLVIIAIIVCIDQLSKWLVVHNMSMYEAIPVIGDYFYIHYIPNKGIAFGALQDKQSLVISITGLLMAGLLFLLLKYGKSLGSVIKTCLAVIIGGGIGNIIDRIRLSYVIDFLDVRIWSYIFNMADVAVVCGCFALIIYMLLIEPKAEKKRKVTEDNR